MFYQEWYMCVPVYLGAEVHTGSLQLQPGSRRVVHLCQHRQECSAHSAFHKNMHTARVSVLALCESS